MTFNPESARQFRFVGYEFVADAAELRLTYELDEISFTERIVFSGCESVDVPIEGSALDRSFRLVHLLAGISYYKAAIPDQIIMPSYAVDEDTATFVTSVYHQGLGEFAYRNGLDVRNVFRLTPNVGSATVTDETPPQGVVVPLGGGKDSLVSVEVLKSSGSEFSTIAVGQSSLIGDTAELTGVPHIRIERYLDSRLFELNQAGAYNGHVPISAILASILLAGSWLYGYSDVAMSNERSASEGNTVLSDGFVVNHQYSKSAGFERDFQSLVSATISTGFRYFSLLRPLSELQIARAFCRHSQYHQVFSSCNRNFSLTRSAPGRWCCDCPKCRFVFLMMATVMSPAELIGIFGRDLLDDPAQVTGFSELLGINAIKPFECVGEIAESRAAMASLGRQSDWQHHAVVESLAFLESVSQVGMEQFLTLSDERLMPESFRALVECHDWT